jgi:hypothetical protein
VAEDPAQRYGRSWRSPTSKKLLVSEHEATGHSTLERRTALGSVAAHLGIPSHASPLLDDDRRQIPPVCIISHTSGLPRMSGISKSHCAW